MVPVTSLRPVRLRLFWKLGLTYLFLLFAVLLAVDIYAARALSRDYLRTGFEHLESLKDRHLLPGDPVDG